MMFRHICNLKMPNIVHGQEFVDLHRYITLHNLAVVRVHLHFEVGRANQTNYFMHGIVTI